MVCQIYGYRSITPSIDKNIFSIIVLNRLLFHIFIDRDGGPYKTGVVITIYEREGVVVALGVLIATPLFGIILTHLKTKK